MRKRPLTSLTLLTPPADTQRPSCWPLGLRTVNGPCLHSPDMLCARAVYLQSPEIFADYADDRFLLRLNGDGQRAKFVVSLLLGVPAISWVVQVAGRCLSQVISHLQVNVQR